MAALIEKISAGQLTRDAARQASRKPSRGRPKNFIFKYGPKGNPFRLQMTFRKNQVEREEIIDALRKLIVELEQDT